MDGGIKGEEWRINLRIRKKRKDFFFGPAFRLSFLCSLVVLGDDRDNGS